MEETIQHHHAHHEHSAHHHHHEQHNGGAVHHSQRAGHNRRTKTQIRRKVLGNILFVGLSIIAIAIILIIAYDHWFGLF